MNLLIHNITIFTNDDQNRVLDNQAVVIEGSRIEEVGDAAALRAAFPAYRQIDGRGGLLMPGLINAHMHFYSTFARGLSLRSTPANFYEILKMLWWRLDSSLDAEAVYYSTLVPAITAIKRGVTAVIDHHASPQAIDGSLDRIEEALSQVGMRGILCYEVSDRDGRDICRKGLRENERYIDKCQAARQHAPDHLFNAMVGLHASFTLEDRSLEQAAALSQSSGCGCHIHVLEDPVDRRLTEERYSAGVGRRLLDFGILGEQTIAAHGIHLTGEEMDLIAQTGTIVAHNPRSNMNNAVGRTDIFALLQRGILVGIGTDGMSPDVRPDAGTAALLHKHDLQNPNSGWEEIQQIILKNNPEIFRRISGRPLGRIEAGYLADLILIDYYPPTPLTGDNFWGHFLFGIVDAPVNSTIINGKIVMEQQQIPGIDEQKIAAESRRVAERVWQRFAV